MARIKRLHLVMPMVLLAGTTLGEHVFTGSRASGMGGANAASTRDTTAQWHNPAAFGFMGRHEWTNSPADNGNLSEQDFSWLVLDANAGYTMTENMGRYLNTLADIDFDSFGQGSLASASENVKALLSTAAILSTIGHEDAFYVDGAIGTSVQIGRFGIGLRVFGEGAAWALADRENLSLDSFPTLSSIVDEFDAAAIGEGFTWDGNYLLSDEQRASLAQKLGNIDADGDTIRYLDSKFKELRNSGRLKDHEIAGAVDLIEQLDPAAADGIGSNLTSVIGHGFTVVEIPVSYGIAVNENLSLGITAKAMYGSVMGTRIWIFNEDNEEVLDESSDNIENTLTAGLDLGLLYRINKFQFACVGRNLNRPTFNGFVTTLPLNGSDQQVVVPEVNLDPQVTLGAAWMPRRRFTLETNLELLKTGTLLPDYNIQRLSFGTEFDVWVLALRLGTYRNLAEDWSNWVATAGVGLNLFGLNVEVGGAYSLGETVDFDAASVPADARLNISVGMSF